MTGKAIVGITLSIVGMLACLTGYGLFVAPVLLVPGIVLAHLGLSSFRRQHNRTSAPIVITLTLSYIGLLISLGAIGIVARELAKDRARRSRARTEGKVPIYDITANPLSAPGPTESGNGDGGLSTATRHGLEMAFNANNPPLSDCEILLRFGTNSTRWNRSSAPLVRDYLDSNVTGQQWVENSGEQLAELRTILQEVQFDYQLLADEGAKATIKPIIDVNESMFGLYQQLRVAIVDGDGDRQKRLFEELKSAAQSKQELATPILTEIRKSLGPDVADRRLQEMAAEIKDLWGQK